MEKEKVLKALAYLDRLGYLKGEDKEWFERYLDEPDTWALWIDCDEIMLSYAWDTEGIEYGFHVGLREVALATLNYLGVGYQMV